MTKYKREFWCHGGNYGKEKNECDYEITKNSKEYYDSIYSDLADLENRDVYLIKSAPNLDEAVESFAGEYCGWTAQGQGCDGEHHDAIAVRRVGDDAWTLYQSEIKWKSFHVIKGENL